MTELNLNKQLEMFLLHAFRSCYLDKGGILTYEFTDNSLPCIHGDAYVLIKIVGLEVKLEFHNESWKEYAEVQLPATEITCSYLYEWAKKANNVCWERFNQ